MGEDNLRPVGEKSKSIVAMSRTIMAFAFFVIMSNFLGGLIHILLEQYDTNSVVTSEDPMSILSVYYLEGCIMMCFLGVAFLIGGIFLGMKKLWSAWLLTVSSVLFIIIFCAIMILFFLEFRVEDEMQWFAYGALVNALVWSGPFVYLIWFLNREKITSQLS